MNQPAQPWDDAQIHAFVDGELEASLAAKLAADCQHDAGLAARIARQRHLLTRLHAEFSAVLEEPVPERLRQALSPAPHAVTPLGAARAPRARPSTPWWGALAASVVIGIMVGWLMPRGAGLPIEAADGGLLARGALDAALSEQLSTDDATASGVQVALSFRSTDGTWCRSFSLQGIDGLACRSATGWRVEVLSPSATSGTVAGDAYRQAGTPLSSAVLQAISARQSGDTLTSDEERALRDRQWQGDTPPAP